MSNNGLTVRDLAFILGNNDIFLGTKSQQFKQAWEVAKSVVARSTQHPDYNVLVDDMGICPECLKAGWLISEDFLITCLNCGIKYVAFCVHKKNKAMDGEK